MERFAIKIDNRVKLNLYNICRLCGIDNENKIPIIEDVIIIEVDDIEDEPSLCRKILECVGVQVESYDQMPQTVCNLCADKINDFFEYKEMCKATNIQTRKLLGLPPEPIVVTVPKQEVETVVKKKKSKAVKLENSILGFSDTDNKNLTAKVSRLTQKNKKQKNLLAACNSKKSNKIKEETDLLTLKEPNKRERQREQQGKRGRKKRKELIPDESTIGITPLKKPKIESISPIVCTICSKQFQLPTDYNTHIFRYHTPNILEFGCLACREAFFDVEELQNHQLWHKISNTPYVCFKCNNSYDRLTGFTRHLISSCVPENNNLKLVENILCDLCNIEYETENLYNWHSCFIKSNSKCLKCNRHFYKQNLLFKHTIYCNGEQLVKPVVNVVPKKGKKLKKTQFMITTHRSDRSIVKSEPGSIIEIENETQINIPPSTNYEKQQSTIINEPDESFNENEETDFGGGDFQDQSDNEEAIDPIPPPMVQIKQEPIDNIEAQAQPMVTLPLTVNIKQEVLRSEYGDVDENILRNIKKEPTLQKQPALKIKIKKEHGTLNSTFVDEDVISTTATNNSTVEHHKSKHKNKSNKIYKIPKQLAMIIKQEIKDRDDQIDNEEQSCEIDINDTSEFSRNEHNVHQSEDPSDMLNDDISFSVYESSNTFHNNHENDLNLPIITDVTTVTPIQMPLIAGVTTLSNQISENTSLDPLSILPLGIRVKMEFNFSQSPESGKDRSMEADHLEDLHTANLNDDNVSDNLPTEIARTSNIDIPEDSINTITELETHNIDNDNHNLIKNKTLDVLDNVEKTNRITESAGSLVELLNSQDIIDEDFTEKGNDTLDKNVYQSETDNSKQSDEQLQYNIEEENDPQTMSDKNKNDKDVTTHEEKDGYLDKEIEEEEEEEEVTQNEKNYENIDSKNEVEVEITLNDKENLENKEKLVNENEEEVTLNEEKDERLVSENEEEEEEEVRLNEQNDENDDCKDEEEVILKEKRDENIENENQVRDKCLVSEIEEDVAVNEESDGNEECEDVEEVTQDEEKYEKENITVENENDSNAEENLKKDELIIKLQNNNKIKERNVENMQNDGYTKDFPISSKGDSIDQLETDESNQDVEKETYTEDLNEYANEEQQKLNLYLDQEIVTENSEVKLREEFDTNILQEQNLESLLEIEQRQNEISKIINSTPKMNEEIQELTNISEDTTQHINNELQTNYINSSIDETSKAIVGTSVNQTSMVSFSNDIEDFRCNSDTKFNLETENILEEILDNKLNVNNDIEIDSDLEKELLEELDTTEKLS